MNAIQPLGHVARMQQPAADAIAVPIGPRSLVAREKYIFKNLEKRC
jgi:hypothetical protein